MSVSLARRLALLEARLKGLKRRNDVVVMLKDFAQREPDSERTEPVAERLWPCPAECGGRVRTGWPRCDNCGVALAWPER